MAPYPISVVALSFLAAIGMPAVGSAQSSPAREAAEVAVIRCYAQLPATLRSAAPDRAQRNRIRISGDMRRRWQVCAALERDRDDLIAIERLTADLVALVQGGQAGSQPPGVADEAEKIAAALIRTTRRESASYKMVGSPIFNNILIEWGAKERGYCYHWTEALLKALPSDPFVHFERHWGGANIGRATENNAVIVTARGVPVTSGIVYDAWRGAGHPWWRAVRDDHYRWGERYDEAAIRGGLLAGE
ncbi:MAG: hypothetical protein HYV03_02105 [Deltaproteobacteria bacterium]|nr:hypothetical protein [Deltaproteobacteria bacterium]